MERKIENYLLDELDSKGALLAALIDPLDYQSIEDAIKSGVASANSGADYILVGGSTGVQGEMLDEVCKQMKEKISIPLILFPGNVTTLSKHADAVYFMSMLNSRNPYWITGAQTLAAPVVNQMGIEALALGYMVVEPGGTVGWVGDANLIPRSKPGLAAAMAGASQLMGSHFVLTDSGSAPANGPLPVQMAAAVAKSVSIPYILGGGVRTTEQASALVKAGVDIIQVGTALENNSDVNKTVQQLAKSIHDAGASRGKKTFDL
jgi:phosphoglycerol geranylgeranyltransferase